MKVCVPITGKNREEMLGQARVIAGSEHFDSIELVEFRYDLARDLENDELIPLLKDLRDCLGRCKILFTIRTREQGGEFSSGYRGYEAINKTAVESGYVDMVDVELRREGYRRGIATLRDRKTAERIIKIAKDNGVKTIASYHDFSGTADSEELERVFSELKKSGADVLKLALMPKNEEDVLRLMLESRRFVNEDRGEHEFIIISMGRLGAFSRIAGALSGSDYSFMSLGHSSAPGQLSVEDGIKISRILY